MTDVPEAVGRRILRLLAVERGLQDEGQGNAARLFRAAALGETSQRCDEGGRGFNQATFASAGGRTRIPMLWLYGEEDGYYSAASIRRYHEAFAQAGGVATFRLFPAFGADGHRLVDRVEIWKVAADDFLRRLNLSSR